MPKKSVAGDNDVEALHKQIRFYKHRLEQIEASNSWRMTAPYRAVGRLLRSYFKKEIKHPSNLVSPSKKREIKSSPPANELWSVIIPTIWSPGEEFIFKLLVDLNACPHVGEIILIDNKVSPTRSLPRIKKLKHYPMDKNIFVNPAWNLGVNVAQYEYICLLNDDINTDWSVFSRFNEFFNDHSEVKEGFSAKSIGIIGLDQSCLKATRAEPSFKFVSSRPLFYGMMMCMHKTTYSNIPNNIKIYSGDTFIFDTAKGKAKSNVCLCNWPISCANGRVSNSSKVSEFDEIKKNDVESYRSVGKSLIAGNAILWNERSLDILSEILKELKEIRAAGNKKDGG